MRNFVIKQPLHNVSDDIPVLIHFFFFFFLLYRYYEEGKEQ